MKSLSEVETKLLENLEQQVRSSFVERGQALSKIRNQKLYRGSYDKFADYCLDVFGYSRTFYNLCLNAAQVYLTIESYLQTNGLPDPLPSRQRQLRPLVQGKLAPEENGLVWVMAVTLAEGQVPSASIVSEALRLYLEEKSPSINPFKVNQICRIIGTNAQLQGKHHCWCVIAEVHENKCLVQTWDDEFLVPIAYLELLDFSEDEQEQMIDLGERMSLVYESGICDPVAMKVLHWLAKLKRPMLNSLEEKLLRVIEEESGCSQKNCCKSGRLFMEIQNDGSRINTAGN